MLECRVRMVMSGQRTRIRGRVLVVRWGIARTETRRSGAEKDVTRRLRQGEVTGERDDDDCGNPASIERVSLNDENGPSEARS